MWIQPLSLLVFRFNSRPEKATILSFHHTFTKAEKNNNNDFIFYQGQLREMTQQFKNIREQLREKDGEL